MKMEFETKKALLEYLGKDSNDRKLVDRMMSRGEVYMEDWMYVLANKDSVIEGLRKRIEELEKSDTKFISKAMWEKVLNDGEIKRLEEELYEAKEQWKYYEDVCESRRKLMEAIIHETYVISKAKLWNKMEDESDFRLAILERARESLRNK